MKTKNSIRNLLACMVLSVLVVGCTVVEKDTTPDTTVVNPPDHKTDVTITPPAGGGTTTTTGN